MSSKGSSGSVLAFAVCIAVCSLNGCGGSSGLIAPSGGFAAGPNLAGNWLLIGALPFTDSTGTVTNNLYGVSGTFSVVGSNVVAQLSANIPCGSSAFSEPVAVMTGTIAGDGTFSLQSASTSFGTATLTGAVPASSTAGWSGNLALSVPAGSCPFNKEMDFTATQIASLTGTYDGIATLDFVNSAMSSQAVNYRFVLQQGGTGGSAGSSSVSTLSGMVQVGGSRCFSSGTFAATGSGVLGSEFVVSATMNDGSTLSGVGQIMDTGALQLDMFALSGIGGTCGQYLITPFELTRG